MQYVLVILIAVVLLTGTVGARAEPISYVEQYASLKRALSTVKRIQAGDGLTDCGFQDQIFGSPPKLAMKTALLGFLAYDVLYISRVLSDIPEEQWKTKLEDYEKTQLKEIAEGRSKILGPMDQYKTASEKEFKENLARDLSAYSGRHFVPYSTGCGAGDVKLKIIARPPASRIQYMSALYGKICEDKQKTIDSPECSSYWSDSSSDGDMYLSGKFHVRVTWPDGKINLRFVDVDRLQPTEAGTQVVFRIVKGDR
jgi:hypothetical protein